MPNKYETIPSNIRSIIDAASDFAGRHAAEEFSIDMHNKCIEMGVKSPIEMAFLIAYYTVAKVNYEEHSEPLDTEKMSPGIWISPQFPIGPYRADFVVGCVKTTESGLFRKIVVECDGTAFHERNEAERRKEKLRDRYMQKLGFKVFRYTGSELLRDPYAIAVEVIGYVTDQDGILFSPNEFSE